MIFCKSHQANRTSSPARRTGQARGNPATTAAILAQNGDGMHLFAARASFILAFSRWLLYSTKGMSPHSQPIRNARIARLSCLVFFVWRWHAHVSCSDTKPYDACKGWSVRVDQPGFDT